MVSERGVGNTRLVMTVDTQNVIFFTNNVVYDGKICMCPWKDKDHTIVDKIVHLKLFVLIFYVQERIYSVEPPLIICYLLKLPLLVSLVHFFR